MSTSPKFSLDQYRERFPHRADRFVNDESFLEFVKATHVEKRVINESWHKSLHPEDPQQIERMKHAYAIQDSNGYDTYLRVFVLVETLVGTMEVVYGTTDCDFWTQSPLYKQTPLAPYLFKIERNN